MNRKAVFLDIDGTLVRRDGTIPPSAEEALRLAQKNGHEMVLCTGRSYTQIEPFFDLEELDGVVCSAGANVRRRGDILWRGSMEKEYVEQLVSFFRKTGIIYFLQAESGIYAEPFCMGKILEAFLALGRTPEEVEDIFGATNVSEHPENIPFIEKCCYFQCTLEAETVQENLGPYFQVVDSSYKVSRFCDGEVCKAGVNKATGMEKYLAAAGLERKDSIAFGDGPNDLEMLQFAETGVCMGNGTDRLKAEADLVCGDINEDGLYHAFESLCLI